MILADSELSALPLESLSYFGNIGGGAPNSVPITRDFSLLFFYQRLQQNGRSKSSASSRKKVTYIMDPANESGGIHVERDKKLGINEYISKTMKPKEKSRVGWEGILGNDRTAT